MRLEKCGSHTVTVPDGMVFCEARHRSARRWVRWVLCVIGLVLVLFGLSVSAFAANVFVCNNDPGPGVDCSAGGQFIDSATTSGSGFYYYRAQGSAVSTANLRYGAIGTLSGTYSFYTCPVANNASCSGYTWTWGDVTVSAAAGGSGGVSQATFDALAARVTAAEGNIANLQVTVAAGGVPYDYANGGALWAFGFSFTLGLWWLAKNIGLILKAIKSF